MASKVKPVPDGYHTVTPYLIVDDAENVIDFLQKAFDAELFNEMTKRPDDKVMHAALKIGNSMIMIADSSEFVKASPAMLYLYVPDADAAYQKAIKAGGTSIMEPSNQFYGDRSGGVKDPAGNSWFVGTHVEDVSAADLKKRAEEELKKRGKAA
ncbi:VOC family protein [Afipia massiliensis]|uniref:VOC family protein n=2 Tax=Afipia massiliensis TaxID=211460 RepID=A0A4V6BFZ4_9BRAD|nr:VOC family protein [Afipia massiliensis]